MPKSTVLVEKKEKTKTAKKRKVQPELSNGSIIIKKSEGETSTKISTNVIKEKKKKKKKNKGKSKSRERKLNRAIKSEQMSKVTAIKRASFTRQVKLALFACAHEDGRPPLRITPKAINALQEAAEQHMVQRFSDASAIASRHDKLTPTDVDLRLVCSLKPLVGQSNGGSAGVTGTIVNN